MAIFNSYFDITRGYLWTSLDGCPMVSRSFDTAEALDVDIGAYVQKISSLDDWWRWWQQFLLAYPGLSSNYGILWGYRISRKLGILWGYRISRKLGILWGYRISRKLAAYIKLGFNVSITRQIRWFMVHMYCIYIYIIIRNIPQGHDLVGLGYLFHQWGNPCLITYPCLSHLHVL